jgi:hypothetical protein
MIEHAQVFGLFEKVPTNITTDPSETRLNCVDGNPVKAKLRHFGDVARVGVRGVRPLMQTVLLMIVGELERLVRGGVGEFEGWLGRWSG